MAVFTSKITILPAKVPLYLAKSATESAFTKTTSALIGPLVLGVHALGEAISAW